MNDFFSTKNNTFFFLENDVFFGFLTNVEKNTNFYFYAAKKK